MSIEDATPPKEARERIARTVISGMVSLARDRSEMIDVGGWVAEGGPGDVYGDAFAGLNWRADLSHGIGGDGAPEVEVGDVRCGTEWADKLIEGSPEARELIINRHLDRWLENQKREGRER